MSDVEKVVLSDAELELAFRVRGLMLDHMGEYTKKIMEMLNMNGEGISMRDGASIISSEYIRHSFFCVAAAYGCEAEAYSTKMIAKIVSNVQRVLMEELADSITQLRRRTDDTRN